MRVLAIAARVIVLLVVILVSSCRDQSEASIEATAGAVSSASDWQAACEAQLDSVKPSSVTIGPMKSNLRWTLDPTLPLGRVVGLAWDADRGEVLAADNSTSQVVVLDTLGRRTATIGRFGEGPGDLNLQNIDGGTNRLALLGDGSIVVVDARHTQVFTHDGRPQARFRTDSLSTLNRFDMQLAPVGAGGFVFPITGKQHSGTTDFNDRTRLALTRVDLVDRTPTQTMLGSLRNSYVMLAPTNPFPGYQPYRAGYRRSWGGYKAGIVAVSWKHFGICYFDWTGRVVSAYSLNADRLRVDDEEKERVLKAEMGTTGHVPFLKATAAELYADHWPTEGPFYTDLVVDDEGSAWLLRRRQDDSQVVDVYGPAGYRSSFVAPKNHLPLVLADSLAFYFNRETGVIDIDDVPALVRVK